MKHDAREPRKRPYQKPALETERIFEVNAQSCGKCVSGPTSGFICNRLKKFS